MTTAAKLRAAFIAALGALLVVGSAHAHARYLRSEPGDGAVVAAPPERVDVWFTQELFRRQGENWIRVTSPNGDPVHAGEAQIDDDDRTHMWVVLQPGLAPGAYSVEWRTLSAEDGDTDEDSFTFTLDPQAEATSTPMLPTTATPPGGTPSPGATAATPVATATTAPALSQPTPTPAAPAAGGSRCGLGVLGAVATAGLALRRGWRRANAHE